MAGAALAVVVLGPVLGPGALLNLDLVLTDPVPVPRGVWGLGPELPRRVPLWLPLAWLSPVVSGELLGKLLMAATVTVAFAGAWRLTEKLAASPMTASRTGAGRRPRPGEHVGDPLGGTATTLAAASAALLYAANPFLLTRLSVGHLMVAVPMAVLPWALPVLLRPTASLRRTFLASLGLAVAGHLGGVVALVVVAVGLVIGPRRRFRGVVDVLAVTLLAQLPWLLPGLVVLRAGGGIVDAAPFATRAAGPAGAAALLVGHGFWQATYQVGESVGWSAAAAGAVLLALAAVGTTSLDRAWRAPLLTLAAIGVAVALASALPGVRDGYAVLSRLPGASLLRESQRLLFLELVWLAPTAALGAQTLARRRGSSGPDRTTGQGGTAGPPRGAGLRAVVATLPLALATVLALPGLWGIDPRLRPVTLPRSWADARVQIHQAPGTVAVLPWHQYFDVDVGGRRRVLDPMPLYLGGDVVGSSDPELGQPDRRERVDPREPGLDRIMADARQGLPVGERLGELGVRWLVVLHAADWRAYRGVGPVDTGLRPVVSSDELDLYEVRSWPGLVATRNSALPAEPVVEPYLDVPASDEAVVAAPAAPGWLRGTRATSSTSTGLRGLPAGTGPVWYWPTLVVLAGQGLTAVGLVVALWPRSVARRRRPRPVVTPRRDTGSRTATELY